jgi:invasion protein IalB
MRRGSKIALLAVGGSALVLISAAAAFLIGHDIGTSERLTINRALRAREQSAVAEMNVTKSAFQAWSFVCRNPAGSERRCVLFIAVADPGLKQVLLTLSIATTPNGMPGLIVDTPASVAVDQGITVTAGAAEALKIPIQSCGQQRCRAITELTSSLQAALETAAVTSVTYTKADNRQSTYNLPTGGFKDGIAAWYAAGESLAKPVPAAVN